MKDVEVDSAVCPQPVLGRLGEHMWVYCTSAVHVTGHYRVQVASLEV